VSSWDSSVSVVTRLQTGQARNHFSIYYRGEISVVLHSFMKSLIYKNYGEPFARVKERQRDAYYLLSSSGKVKKDWLYVGTLLYVFMTCNWKNIFYIWVKVFVNFVILTESVVNYCEYFLFFVLFHLLHL